MVTKSKNVSRGKENKKKITSEFAYQVIQTAQNADRSHWVPGGTILGGTQILPYERKILLTQVSSSKTSPVDLT